MLVSQDIKLSLLLVVQNAFNHSNVVNFVNISLLTGRKIHELTLLWGRNNKCVLVYVWLKKMRLSIDFVLELDDGRYFFGVNIQSENLVKLSEQYAIRLLPIFLLLEMEVHTDLREKRNILQYDPSVLLQLPAVTAGLKFVNK